MSEIEHNSHNGHGNDSHGHGGHDHHGHGHHGHVHQHMPAAGRRSDDPREKEIYKVTVIGMLGGVALLIFKMVAGIVGRSAAMIADAVHSLSDFVTDIIVIVFVHIANKPLDRDHEYGHGKYETLATAVIGILLFFVGLGILIKGAQSIWAVAHGEILSQPGVIALVAALVSIATKEVLYRYTVAKGRKLNSQAVIANAWHHRSDALSSIGTAIGIGGAILLGEKWRVLDPIASIVVSFAIMKVAVELLVPCLGELMEKSLPEETENEIKKALMEFPQVSRPHNLRTRKIGNRSSVEVHVRMDGEMTVNQSHEITRRMERRLKDLLGQDTFISIHVEPEKPEAAKAAADNADDDLLCPDDAQPDETTPADTPSAGTQQADTPPAGN